MLAPANGGDRALNYLRYLIAREVTLWHYQWLLVNEHLPQICGQQVVSDVLANGNLFYRPPPGDALMPIELGAACYRFGHSMVRPSYRANFTSGTGDSARSLPSGQSVAQAMGVAPLTAADLAGIGAVYAPFATSTPLWYYILAESKIAADGLNLGPVAGRIVAETLIGLLRADPSSYLSVYRGSRRSSAPTARWARPRTGHHRQPELHPGALPLLRRRRPAGHLPLTGAAHGPVCRDRARPATASTPPGRQSRRPGGHVL